jgi:3-methyladenine DNA glycosylase/8-oxoguanine DNA glycosylase
MAELKRAFSFTLRPRPPYDFALTARKPAGWPLFTPLEVYQKGTLWTAIHIKEVLVGLKLKSKGTVDAPAVSIEVFQPGKAAIDRHSVKEAVGFRLGVDQDLGPFYRMARRDPILKHTIGDLYGLHDTDPDSLFSEATLAILLQMAPLKRSMEMMDCVILSFGDIAIFNGKKIHAWPTPKQIGGLTVRDLEKCRLGYRAKRLLQLAKVLKESPFTIEELKRSQHDERKKRLLELPGIGDYSADIISGGFPIDAWSADVFGRLFYGHEPEEGREAIAGIKAEGLRRWGDHAWLAFLYVVQDLEGLSKKLKTPLRLQ